MIKISLVLLRMKNITAVCILNLCIFLEPHASTLPRVTFSQTQVRTEEGSFTQLPCVAQGNPPPTYR